MNFSFYASRIGFLLLFLIGINVNAQNPVSCPTISTGNDTTICSGACANLYANAIASVNQSTSYNVSSIPYAPYTFNSGTPILVGQDDIWSSSVNLGFTFCFYGNSFTKAVIGANGQITFDLTQAGAWNNYVISQAFPNTAELPGNTICAAFRDIDPSVSGNIYFQTVGSAPCRKLVISWYDIPLYDGLSGCGNSALSRFQMVLYETTNYIDIFIQKSPSCNAWNDGNGIVGIQNANATQSVVAPGRNFPTNWTANNEGWRFSPTGPSQYSVSWKDNNGNTVGTGQNISVCPTNTTTYTATLNISNCAGSALTYTDNVTVNVSTSSAPIINVNNPIACVGDVVTLTANGAATYSWSPSTGLSSDTGSSVQATTNTSTTYTVSGTGVGCNGLVGTSTSFITVHPLPAVSSSNNSPICVGQDFQLSANGGLLYQWTGPNGFSSTVQNPIFNSVAITDSGIYQVTVTDSNGCSNSSATNVIITNGVQLTALADNFVCLGDTVRFSVNSNVNTTFTWSPSNLFSDSLSATPEIIATSSNIYTVSASSGTCSGTDTILITVNIPSGISAGADILLCPQITSNIIATGGTTYTWSSLFGNTTITSNNSLNSNINVESLGYDELMVESNDINGCVNFDTVIINTLTNPIADFSITDVCLGQNSVYSDLSTPPPNETITNWYWDYENNLSVDNNNQNNTHLFTNSGVYTTSLVVTSSNGCNDTIIKSTTIFDNPIANFNVSDVCYGTSSILKDSSTSATNDPISIYNWDISVDGNIEFTSAIASTILPVGTNTIELYIESAFGCRDSITKTINVNPIPSASFFGVEPACYPLCTKFNENSTGQIKYYIWNFGDGTKDTLLVGVNSHTHCYNSGNNYSSFRPSLIVESSFGCKDTAYAIGYDSVIVYPKPVAEFLIENPNTDILNPEVLVIDQSINSDSLLWQFSDSNLIHSLANQNTYFMYSDTGKHIITQIASNHYGCKDTIKHEVNIKPVMTLYIPNAFTPNGKGDNEIFKAYGTGILTFEMNIFDRWGKLIKTMKNINEGWDGTFDGQKSPEDVYVYQVRVTDQYNKEYCCDQGFQGSFTLIR